MGPLSHCHLIHYYYKNINSLFKDIIFLIFDPCKIDVKANSTIIGYWLSIDPVYIYISMGKVHQLSTGLVYLAKYFTKTLTLSLYNYVYKLLFPNIEYGLKEIMPPKLLFISE